MGVDWKNGRKKKIKEAQSSFLKSAKMKMLIFTVMYLKLILKSRVIRLLKRNEKILRNSFIKYISSPIEEKIFEYETENPLALIVGGFLLYEVIVHAAQPTHILPATTADDIRVEHIRSARDTTDERTRK